MTSPLRKDSKILIIGGSGTFGSSTALHLARRGYTNIVAADVFDCPSNQSAGFDLNKIVGGGATTGFRLEAWQAWQADPLYKPHLHKVGRLTTAHNSESIAKLKERFDQNVANFGLGAPEYEWLDTPEDIKKKAWQVEAADLEGWKAIWNSNAGWCEAVDALKATGDDAKRLGVKYITGSAGTFKKPLIAADGKTCIGALMEDGSEIYADRVVMCTGAWSPSLIDLEGQCVSKCWILGHLEFTEEEAKAFEGCPVIYDDELGFFFEPRPEPADVIMNLASPSSHPTPLEATNSFNLPRLYNDEKPQRRKYLMKVCNEFAGFTRKLDDITPFPLTQPQSISVPRSHALHLGDTMPKESYADIHRIVNTLLPLQGKKEILNGKICWCTDTPDAQWLFTQDPRFDALYLATGDSGHSFHCLPVVGSYVADLLEGKLSKKDQIEWGWRPGKGDPGHTGRGGPEPKDLLELPEGKGWMEDCGRSV